MSRRRFPLLLPYGMHVTVPAQNTVEEGERVMLFWQVFIFDHCWAVVSRKPARLRVDEKSDMIITTPWPLWAHEYVAVCPTLCCSFVL